jgi:hypothetical protein
VILVSAALFTVAKRRQRPLAVQIGLWALLGMIAEAAGERHR